jgi:hypothetical protein
MYASNGQHQPSQPYPTIAAAGGNGPLAPHTRPFAPRLRVEWMGNNPPSKRIYFLELLGCAWPSKHSDFVAMHHCRKRFEDHKHPQSPPKYIRKLGGLSPIHLTHWRGAQGLMWGARGPFLLAAAMVVAVVMPVVFCAKATEKQNKNT